MLCEKQVLWGKNFGEHCAELSLGDLFCCGPSRTFHMLTSTVKFQGVCVCVEVGRIYTVFLELLWSWKTLPLPCLASHLKELAFYRMHFGNCILAWNHNWPGSYQWKGKVFSSSSKGRQSTTDLHCIRSIVILKVSCAFIYFLTCMKLSFLSH